MLRTTSHPPVAFCPSRLASFLQNVATAREFIDDVEARITKLEGQVGIAAYVFRWLFLENALLDRKPFAYSI